MIIGVLALQGAFKEHISMLERVKAKYPDIRVREVRLPQDLKEADGLIIPGGESTTMTRLMQEYSLDKEIIRKARSGMAIFGTCAGAILLASEICQEEPKLGLIDISIQRNAYGSQIDSFKEEIDIKDIGSFKAVFIRAPVIERCGKKIEILAKHDNRPVLVKEGKILASTFHPELTDDSRLHEKFVLMCK